MYRKYNIFFIYSNISLKLKIEDYEILSLILLFLNGNYFAWTTKSNENLKTLNENYFPWKPGITDQNRIIPRITDRNQLLHRISHSHRIGRTKNTKVDCSHRTGHTKRGLPHLKPVHANGFHNRGMTPHQGFHAHRGLTPHQGTASESANHTEERSRKPTLFTQNTPSKHFFFSTPGKNTTPHHTSHKTHCTAHHTLLPPRSSRTAQQPKTKAQEPNPPQTNSKSTTEPHKIEPPNS